MKNKFNSWLYKFKEEKLTKLLIPENIWSIDKFIMTLPDGVFTSLRTVRNKQAIFQYNYHLNRLSESINLAGYEIDFSLFDLKKPIKEVLKIGGEQEIRIRILIPLVSDGISYLFAEKLIQPDPLDYKNGVKVGINHLLRENPKAKLTSFIHRSERVKHYCRQHSLEESIIVNQEDELLEGLSSNFFAVKDGKIFTAERDVLKGSVREIILNEAYKNNIQLEFLPISVNDLSKIDETFITSTSRGVLPVVRIGEEIIGNGKPGPITLLLMNKFNKKLVSESEEI